MARRRRATRPTAGSLFSGYGGLDLAVEAVFGARTVWHVENDPDASKVLAARWPGIPNHGDITEVDWAQVEPVDILCGGFPCQDISSAGLGAGIIEGTRSGLWFRYADAIRVLRPRLVVVENVGMLLRRGMGVVLGDLADLGYDARWASVRASDVGAPHRRQRVFIVAHARSIGRYGRQGVEGGGRDAAERGEARGHAGDGAPPSAHPDLVAGWPTGEAELRDGPQAHRGRGPARARRRSGLAADADSAGREARHVGPGPGNARRLQPVDRRRTAWDQYAPAIHRWEAILGRPAPEPTDDKGRLSAPFVEWMMGLPAGWVSDVVARRPALRCLGNGVVPQQAEYAIKSLHLGV